MPSILRTTLGCAPVLLLLACAGREKPVPNGAPAASTNAVLFDPASGDIPLPNVLATAVAPDPLQGRSAGVPMTPPEALAYINTYEVGGTNAVAGMNAPIYLRFTYPVDPTTVTAANIKVFMITPDAAGTENNPLTFTDVTGEFTFNYPAGGTDLWLYPAFPLLPGTRYLYVVTSGVHDAATHAPVIPSLDFQYLQSPTIPTGAAAALAPIWADATSGGNILLSGYGKVMSDLITASSTTGITSRSQVALMGRFITSGAGFIAPSAASPSTMIPVESALRAFAAGGLPGGLPGKTWSNAATIATTLSGSAAVGAYWNKITGAPAATVPASIGSVVLGSINSGLLGVDPVVVGQNLGSMDLTAVASTAVNDAAGVTQPYRSLGALVGYYHVPNAVPFVYVTPATLAPTGGYPLVIYQHGITSQKETVMLLAQALTSAGYAALAIDLPMHGSLATAGRTSSQWGEDFMAVGAPLATRSNIQQAAFNLDRLEFTVRSGGLSTSLAGAGQGALAPSVSNLHFVGISLGSIVGAYYLAGNTTLATSGAPYTPATLAQDMKGLLSVPGGRLAYLIQASPAFGPTINQGLAQQDVIAGTPTYNQFFQVTQSVVDSADPASMATPLAAGLPSRLAGRVLVQEATSSTFDASGNPTNGDLVITNPYTRYFGNALGGWGLLGADIDPGFFQLGYGATDTIPATFLMTLQNGAPAPKTESAALTPLATGPTEGYFQFNQAGIEHGALLDLSTAQSQANALLLQRQMVYFLGVTGTSIVVDPTQPGL